MAIQAVAVAVPNAVDVAWFPVITFRSEHARHDACTRVRFGSLIVQGESVPVELRVVSSRPFKSVPTASA